MNKIVTGLIMMVFLAIWTPDLSAQERIDTVTSFENGKDTLSCMLQYYNNLMEMADSIKEYDDHSFPVHIMTIAGELYSWNLIDTTETLVAYTKAKGMVESQLEFRPRDSYYIEAANTIDSIFRSSGAMTCTSIEKIYSEKISKDLHDTVLIKKIIGILAETGCAGSDFYYSLVVKLYANKRSAENAVRLAELNLARKNRNKAEFYFSEAFKADSSKIVKSFVLTRLALTELASGKRQEARNYAQYAWELNSKNGEALMIIADAYAGSEIGDAFDNHSVYWVAVDYLNRAKRADSSLEAAANEKIQIYSKLFPTREEGFFRRINDEGIAYNVGSWIGEVTVIRFRSERTGHYQYR